MWQGILIYHFSFFTPKVEITVLFTRDSRNPQSSHSDSSLAGCTGLLISLVNKPLLVFYFFRFHLYFADGLEKCLTTDSRDAINILLFQTRHANALVNIKHETS